MDAWRPGKLLGEVAHALRTSWREHRASWWLFIGASAFYGLALHWGLPNAHHPDLTHGWATDAVTPLGPLAQVNDWLFLREYNWPPYPLFHYLLLAVLFAPYLGLLWLTGELSGFTATYPFGLADPVRTLHHLELIGKAFSMFTGGVLVVAARHTAWELWGRHAGWLAAGLAGTLYPVVYYMRNANPDGPMLAYIALALWVLTRIVTRGFTVPRAVTIGLLAAVAIASKDLAWGSFFLLPLGIAIADVRQRRAAGEVLNWRPYVWGPVACFAAYVVCTGMIINPMYHWTHVVWVQEHLPFPLQISHPATPEGFLGLLADIARHVTVSGDPLLVPLALGGFCWLLWRRSRGVALCLAPLGLFLGVLILTRMSLVRYVITISYVAALFSAALLAAGLTHPRRPVRIVAGLAATMALGWQVVMAADLTWQMWNDSRYEASAWLSGRVGEGTMVAIPVSPNNLPRLPEGVEYVQIDREGSLEEATAILAAHRPEWVLMMPDWTAEVDAIHSRFLDPRFYQGLADGRMGYRLARRFQTPALQGQVLDYPTVNPPIELYIRADLAESAAEEPPSQLTVADPGPE